MERVFDLAVYILQEISSMLGITYEALNVWLFIIILPTLFHVSLLCNIIAFIKRKRKNETKETN